MKHRFYFCWFFLALVFLVSPLVHAQEADPALTQAIIDGCTYGQITELSDYALTADAFDALFTQLEDAGKLPWYTTSGYSYRYNERTGILQDFTPKNLDPQVYDRTLYEQKLAEVMDACIHEGMDAVQIALSVHDHLVLNNVYDETLEANTGYDLLVRGTTVCAGYTELYRDILNRAGVPCISVTSEPMEHTWNLVQIDGQWYHVDVTWDDPSPDVYGYVSHQYFLVTDSEIAAGEDPHYDWVTDITCTDTRFSDAWWRDIDSGIFYESNATSCFLRSEDFTNYVCRRDEATGTETVLYTDQEPYVDIGYGDYTYSHTGLARRGDRLLFSTLDAVRSVDADGNDLQVEYRHSGSDYIYSFHVCADTVYLTLSDHDGNMHTSTGVLSPAGGHIHSYTETLQPATCEQGGYTTSACSCGLTCRSEPTPATGHAFKELSSKAATVFSDGFSQDECTNCSQVQTRQLPRLDLGDWLRENLRTVVVIGLVVATLLTRLLRAKKRG